MQVMEEMKLILGKKDKDFDMLKARTKKVLAALESIIPKKCVTKKVRILSYEKDKDYNPSLVTSQFNGSISLKLSNEKKRF